MLAAQSFSGPSLIIIIRLLLRTYQVSHVQCPPAADGSGPRHDNSFTRLGPVAPTPNPPTPFRYSVFLLLLSLRHYPGSKPVRAHPNVLAPAWIAEVGLRTGLRRRQGPTGRGIWGRGRGRGATSTRYQAHPICPTPTNKQSSPARQPVRVGNWGGARHGGTAAERRH